MAYASSTAGAGRGGRSVREETRTCWYYFQAGHLKANCHIWQLVQSYQTNRMSPSYRQHPRRFHAPRPGASAIPSTSIATNIATSLAGAAKVVTEHTTHVAAAGLKYPPGLIARAQALLAKPRKVPTRRYVPRTAQIWSDRPYAYQVIECREQQVIPSVIDQCV
ncbi:hypothetical protein N7489_005431 [Penicillium chrysogenum]|uniref:uncharacterized protein n=1 Tax=Penicillium chrysogenum TaxID=5076 RepID=UPI0024DF0EA6|nr:uncharacterized protein N7489_005431 [Penicillium chrysogenum]KAJ5245335.1 hypothetical protein N7489_005431 [Penicillium chrysogenum]